MKDQEQYKQYELITDVLRWYDDLCDIMQNNPADVESWITNGADHFDALKEQRV